jgi:hypothetical protein
MKAKTEWSVSDISNDITSKAIRGCLPLLEFKADDGEWHDFDIVVTPERVVFGGCCNVGFLESGYIIREEYETLDETLSELLADLECYYNDGPQYVSRIVCNERM